ncbi:MAG: hybrid sensor histidine kinase/response regulator [Rhizobiaceae bacterium]|nr:hybrid sensor histidine kinase/response regulator [Rhizobiaceae bacterium]
MSVTLADRDWELDLLFGLGLSAWIVHAGVVLLTAGTFVGLTDGVAFTTAWLAAMLMLSAGLAVLSWKYARRRPTTKRGRNRHALAHSALTACTGLGWGAGALVAAGVDFQVLLLYSLALGGTALGAVSTQHSFPRSCFLSLWTSIPMLAAAHVWHDPSAYGAINGSMVVLYTIVLSSLALRMHRFLRTNVGLTRSLDAKVAELTKVTDELEHARRQASEANLAKSRFLGQASHDLRQPIHAIGLLVANLKELRLGRSEREVLGSIERSVQSLAHLFRSLLDLSLLDVGRTQVRNEPVNLGELLAGLVRQNLELARRSGCELRFVQPRAWVETDPALLTAILQNLLANAFKYASRARVLVGARRNGAGYDIWVCDAGPGIHANDLAHVFQEFYRAETPAVQGQEGVGLGLAIARRVGAALGLEIVIHSAPRRGTRVVVSGLSRIAPPLVAKRRSGHRAHPLSGFTVAVVDDDEDVLAATASLLERWGCKVVSLREAPDEPIGCDAIVCDFDLGRHGSAPAIIHAIRKQENRAVPAVILSGHTQEPRASPEEPAVPRLQKPVQPAELRALLTSFALARGRSTPAR